MKKVILGSMMFLSGTLAAAIILAGAMANELNVNGRLSAIWNITQYGLMPAIIFFFYYCRYWIALCFVGSI